MELAIILVLGAVLGSFLNVVIHRLPLRQSIVKPRSHCPKCGHQLRAWENIPVFSYLLLRGRCARCRKPIPLRYLLVETLTPALLAGLYLLYGPQWEFFKNSILILLLIPASFIDLDHRLILNKITFPGMILGLALSIWQNPGAYWQPIFGLLAGGGFLYLIALVGQMVYKQESMGGGDIKFGAMIGSFTTAPGILLSLFLAFFIASLFIAAGMALGRVARRSTVPFGPFIAIGTLVGIGFYDQLVQFYLRLIGM